MLKSNKTTMQDLRSALPDLVMEAKERGREFERARKLATDFTDRLKRAGAFKVLVPADSGGLGASLTEWLEVMIALGEADASTGWVTAHANICAGLIHAAGDPRLREEFFADPNACAAWSSVPRVQVIEQAYGVRIKGSWSFERGCTAATFVGGMINLSPDSHGRPRMIAALAPISEARIEEVWDPIGLAGTGSHDVHFDDVFVPWHRTFSWPAGRAKAPFPTAAFFPGNWFISMGASATHLGLARRALDEARNELRGKVDRYTGKPVAENAAVLRSLEAAEGLWFACRAGLREALGTIWDHALRSERAPEEAILTVRVACVTATQRCAEIVRTAYDMSGTSAMRNDGVMQKLLRDTSCLTHHVSSNQGSYELTGRVRFGLDQLSFKV